jgi:chemotaxis protein MotA
MKSSAASPHWPGLVAAFALLLAAAFIAQVPLASWWHPAGWVLVFGGTYSATHLSTPKATFAGAIQQLLKGLVQPPHTLASQVDELVQLSHYVRKNGLLALQPMMGELSIRQPFLHRGLEMAMDNLSASLIKDRLATEIETTYRHNLDQSRVFETAAGYAPTMGLMGAILGLMQALNGPTGNMQAMTSGVGSALSATLLGIAMANLMLLPVAARSKQLGRDTWLMQTLMLQGVLSIQAGEHPHLLREKLSAYLIYETVLQSSAEEAEPETSQWDEAPMARGVGEVEGEPLLDRRRNSTGAFANSGSAASVPTGLGLPSSMNTPLTRPSKPGAMPAKGAPTRPVNTALVAANRVAPPKAAAAYAATDRYVPPASTGAATKPPVARTTNGATRPPARRPLPSV